MLHPIIQAYCEEDVTDIRGFDRSVLVSAEEGRFVMRAYPGPDCGNNIGTVHGGFLLGLVDIAGTGAVDTLGRENATMSLTTNFLRPAYVSDEYLEVTGTVLKPGKRAVVAEVEIRRPNDELVLKATVTSAVFESDITELPRFQNVTPPLDEFSLKETTKKGTRLITLAYDEHGFYDATFSDPDTPITNSNILKCRMSCADTATFREKLVAFSVYDWDRFYGEDFKGVDGLHTWKLRLKDPGKRVLIKEGYGDQPLNYEKLWRTLLPYLKSLIA